MSVSCLGPREVTDHVHTRTQDNLLEKMTSFLPSETFSCIGITGHRMGEVKKKKNKKQTKTKNQNQLLIKKNPILKRRQMQCYFLQF